MDVNENRAADLDSAPPTERVDEFIDLYSQHFAQLRYYVMALVPSSSDAADVLQEVSLVLWRRFDTFEPGTNFFAWACKIARLQALRHSQRSNRSARVFDTSVLEQLAVEAIPASSQPPRLMELLQSCLARLSAADRTLIQRRYRPDSSVKKIAAETGRSANSLSKSLGRIRRALMNCIERKLIQEE